MAITRVTTPTNKFVLPIDPATLEKIKITYAQKDKIIFTKNKPDVRIDGNKIFVDLSQAETKLLDSRYHVQVQLRALTYNGKALASQTFERTVKEVLDDEIL